MSKSIFTPEFQELLITSVASCVAEGFSRGFLDGLSGAQFVPEKETREEKSEPTIDTAFGTQEEISADEAKKAKKAKRAESDKKRRAKKKNGEVVEAKEELAEVVEAKEEVDELDDDPTTKEEMMAELKETASKHPNGGVAGRELAAEVRTKVTGAASFADVEPKDFDKLIGEFKDAIKAL